MDSRRAVGGGLEKQWKPRSKSGRCPKVVLDPLGLYVHLGGEL